MFFNSYQSITMGGISLEEIQNESVDLVSITYLTKLQLPQPFHFHFWFLNYYWMCMVLNFGPLLLSDPYPCFNLCVDFKFLICALILNFGLLLGLRSLNSFLSELRRLFVLHSLIASFFVLRSSPVLRSPGMSICTSIALWLCNWGLRLLF